MLSLLLISIVAATNWEVELQTVDGRAVRGAVERIGATELVVRTGDATVTLPATDLLQLAPISGAPAAKNDDAKFVVELAGGSRLRAAGYLVDGDAAQVELKDAPPLKAAVHSVQSVHDADATEAELQQWGKINAGEAVADVLVVRKKDALDFLEGVLHGVTAEHVEFEVDGETIPVKWSKVFGFIYQPRARDIPAANCRIFASGGAEFAARELQLAGDALQVVLTTGDAVSIPLERIERVDFSHGKVLYLSDLEWDAKQSERQSFFGATTPIDAPHDLFTPQHDRALDGGELLLAGRSHARGVALHSRTRLVYRLPDGYQRFTALAGIDDRMDRRGDVIVAIEGDGRRLLQFEARGGQPPTPIDLDITGVQRLAIVVDFGANQDVADHLNLCEAKLIR